MALNTLSCVLLCDSAVWIERQTDIPGEVLTVAWLELKTGTGEQPEGSQMRCRMSLKLKLII